MPEDDSRHTWSEAVQGLAVPDDLRQALLAITGSFVAHSHPLPTEPEPPGPAPDLGRFRDLGELGRGGLGVVRRVHDPTLQRVTALKTLQRRWAHHESLQSRFLQEAQLTAQLQHPGIPPVHEFGTLPDGRAYFTMPEVRGARLDDAIQSAHASAGPARLRRLVEYLRRVAETVGYAHSRGVLHRDLKPSNVMLGEFGEVWVLDWGLGKIQGQGHGPMTTTTTSLETQQGSIHGTPAFMAPEQAHGDLPVGPPADAYALGGLLHVALTGARHRPTDPFEALEAACSGTAPVALQSASWPVPPELETLCLACLSPNPDDRPTLASAATALLAWLDGAKTRERALEVLERATERAARAAGLREQAADLRRDADALEPTHTREQSQWWPAWELEDRADALEEEGSLEDVHADHLAQAALTHAPGLAAIRTWIADRALDRHRQADARGDRPSMARESVTLAEHGSPRHAAYLEGRAALSLTSDPEGAEVVLHRWVTRHRLMVLEPVRSLGRTPLVQVPLDHGSWVVELRHPDRVPVRRPVLLARGGEETGCRPGQREPHPVYLPHARELGPEDCYVPAGPTLVGRDHELDSDIVSMPRTRLWVHGFVVRRFPVTTGDYVAYLNDLMNLGDHELALARVPRHLDGEPRLGRDAQDHFVVGDGPQGEIWEDRSPMVMMPWTWACDFAAWRAERDALPWRLGWEVEWERAARGADGRPWPWGWHAHPTWARMRATPDVTGTLSSVDAFPSDVSPFGVRGLGGNASDWVLDPHPTGFCRSEGGVALPPDPSEGPRRRIKGGGHPYRPFNCRADGQLNGVVNMTTNYLGTRLFRPLDPHHAPYSTQ